MIGELVLSLEFYAYRQQNYSGALDSFILMEKDIRTYGQSGSRSDSVLYFYIGGHENNNDAVTDNSTVEEADMFILDFFKEKLVGIEVIEISDKMLNEKIGVLEKHLTENKLVNEDLIKSIITIIKDHYNL